MISEKRNTLLDTNVIYDWTGQRREHRLEGVEQFLLSIPNFHPSITLVTLYELVRTNGSNWVSETIKSRSISILTPSSSGASEDMGKILDETSLAALYLSGHIESTEKYILQSFIILVRVLCSLPVLALAEDLSIKQKDNPLFASNLRLVIKVIDEVWSKEAATFCQYFFAPDNEARTRTLKESIRTLTAAHANLLRNLKDSVVGQWPLSSEIANPLPPSSKDIDEGLQLASDVVDRFCAQATETLLSPHRTMPTFLSYKYNVGLAAAYYTENRSITINDIADAFLFNHIQDSMIVSADGRVRSFLAGEDPVSHSMCVRYEQIRQN